jgi:hypothetical protein
MIPIPPALLLWAESMIITFGSVYYALATVAGMVPSCVWPCSQPHDAVDRPREVSRSRRRHHVVKVFNDAVVHGEDLEKGKSCDDHDTRRQLGV